MDEDAARLRVVLQALQAHVDQLAAEFEDPQCSPERQVQIRAECAEWLAACQKIEKLGVLS